MHLAVVQKILGILLIIFSTSMVPPMVVSLIYSDGALLPFVFGFVLILVIGTAIWFPVRNNTHSLRTRDGFLVVVLFWIALGLSGTAPFLIAEEISLSFTDAAFESISGLTTTGATILTEISTLPKSILYYRQQLHWFGGMGIIVLAVAILPMLGIGGMQMFKAETTGPSKDTKLTPRIRETAKILWSIYVSLTVICALSFWLAGMNMFDAICHSFATVATGGFSNYEASIGYFDSQAIEWLTTFFMFLAGANFSLHFLALRALSQSLSSRSGVQNLSDAVCTFWLNDCHDTSAYPKL
jgi:trk system potassium uptake protein TrkH